MSSQSHHSPRFYLLLLLSVLSFVLALFIGTRLVHRLMRNPRPIPRQTNVMLIQTWMSLPYISKTYNIPMSVFDDAYQLDRKNSFENLSTIARIKGISTDELVGQIQSLITTYQIAHPRQPAISP